MSNPFSNLDGINLLQQIVLPKIVRDNGPTASYEVKADMGNIDIIYTNQLGTSVVPVQHTYSNVINSTNIYTETISATQFGDPLIPINNMYINSLYTQNLGSASQPVNKEYSNLIYNTDTIYTTHLGSTSNPVSDINSGTIYNGDTVYSRNLGSPLNPINTLYYRNLWPPINSGNTGNSGGGVTGPQGPTGTAGAPGVTGISLIMGSGPPTNFIGSIGDSYIDSTTYTLYGPKSTANIPSNPFTFPTQTINGITYQISNSTGASNVFQLYGTGLQPDGSVCYKTASNYFNDGSGYTGTTTTLVNGSTISGEWTQFYVSTSQLICQLNLNNISIGHEATRPKDIVIVYSDDATTWLTAYDGIATPVESTGPNSQVFKIAFNPITTTVVRLIIRSIYGTSGTPGLSSSELANLTYGSQFFPMKGVFAGTTGSTGTPGTPGVRGATGLPGATGASSAVSGPTGQIVYFNSSGFASSPDISYDGTYLYTPSTVLDDNNGAVVRTTTSNVPSLQTYIQSGTIAKNTGVPLQIGRFGTANNPTAVFDTQDKRVFVNKGVQPLTIGQINPSLDIDGQTQISLSGSTASTVVAGVSGYAGSSGQVFLQNSTGIQYNIYGWGQGGFGPGGLAGGEIELFGLTGGITLNWNYMGGGTGIFNGGNALFVYQNGVTAAIAYGGGGGGSTATLMTKTIENGQDGTITSGGTGGFASYDTNVSSRFNLGLNGGLLPNLLIPAGSTSIINPTYMELQAYTSIRASQPFISQQNLGSFDILAYPAGTIITLSNNNSTSMIANSCTFSTVATTVNSNLSSTVLSQYAVESVGVSGITGNAIASHTVGLTPTITISGSNTPINNSNGFNGTVSTLQIDGSITFTLGSTASIQLSNTYYTNNSGLNLLMTADNSVFGTISTGINGVTGLYLPMMNATTLGKININSQYSLPTNTTLDVVQSKYFQYAPYGTSTKGGNGIFGSGGGGGGFFGGGGGIVGGVGGNGSSYTFSSFPYGIRNSQDKQPYINRYNPLGIYGSPSNGGYLVIETINTQAPPNPALIVNGNLTASNIGGVPTNFLIGNVRIQSGYIQLSPSSVYTTGTVTFPVAFTNVPNISLTLAGLAQSNCPATPFVLSPAVNNFTFAVATTGTSLPFVVYWFAIGN